MKRPIITLTFSLFFIFTSRVLAAGEGPTGTDAHGLDPAVLIGIAIMLVIAKLGGELFERMRQPGVLGELFAGILLGIGVPNVMEFQRNGVMTAVANDAVTAVLMARTEAVKRQAPVAFCLSENPTDDPPTCSPDPVEDLDAGFIVWVDDNDNRDATTGARILTDATDENLEVDDDELVLMRSEARGGTVRVSANCGEEAGSRTRIQSGFFSTGVSGLCAFSGCRGRVLSRMVTMRPRWPAAPPKSRLRQTLVAMAVLICTVAARGRRRCSCPFQCPSPPRQHPGWSR